MGITCMWDCLYRMDIELVFFNHYNECYVMQLYIYMYSYSNTGIYWLKPVSLKPMCLNSGAKSVSIR